MTKKILDKTILQKNPYGTHQPILVELLLNTTGNIIEFGCGNTSTDLIKTVIKGTNRKLISLESNLEWFNKFKHLEDENHKLFFVDAGNDDCDSTGKFWIDFINSHDLITNMDFDVCFIDQSPWTARTYALNHYINKIKWIIVHDVDYFPNAGKWGKILAKIPTSNKKLNKYQMDFSDVSEHFNVYYPPDEYFAGDTGPPTLLCSNLADTTEFNEMITKININQYY